MRAGKNLGHAAKKKAPPRRGLGQDQTLPSGQILPSKTKIKTITWAKVAAALRAERMR